MFAKQEFTEAGRFPGDGNATPWLAKKKEQTPSGADPEDEVLEDELEGDDDELDDDLDDDEDDLDDDELDDEDDDEDLDDLDDELDDDLIELDDEYDKGEEEEKRHPDHPRKYDD